MVPATAQGAMQAYSLSCAQARPCHLAKINLCASLQGYLQPIMDPKIGAPMEYQIVPRQYTTQLCLTFPNWYEDFVTS